MPAVNWSEINWFAVLVAGFATLMLGGAWYAGLFGRPWQAAHGFSDETVKQAQAAMNPAKFFGGMFVCYLAVALGMAILAQWCSIATFGGGAVLGLVVGLAIVTPVVLTNHIPSMVKPAGFFIDATCSLIYCVLNGAIVGAWH